MSEAQVPIALLVDCDLSGRAFLRARLKRAAYAVEVAGSAEAALECFRPGTVDVVFMDMLMPGIDGVSMVEICFTDALIGPAAREPAGLHAALEHA